MFLYLLCVYSFLLTTRHVVSSTTSFFVGQGWCININIYNIYVYLSPGIQTCMKPAYAWYVFGHTFDSGSIKGCSAVGKSHPTWNLTVRPLKIDVWNTTVLNRKVYFHGQTGTGLAFCVPKCVNFSHFNIAQTGQCSSFFMVASTFTFILITFTSR